MHTGDPGYLDKDYRFWKFNSALDNLGQHLRKDGTGADVKHASVTNSEEESALWQSSVLGTTTPKALLNAAFFSMARPFTF